MCVCVSGFLEMLTKAQGCRVDDQRGLLTKEQLEIPLFLQLSSDQGPDEAGTTGSPAADSKEVKSSITPSSAGAAEKTSGSDQSKPKDLRETVLWKTVVRLGGGGVTDVIRNYDKHLATSCYQSCQKIETRFYWKMVKHFL